MNKTTSEVEFINSLLLGLFEHTYRDFHENGRLWADHNIRNICQTIYPFSDSHQLKGVLPSETRLIGGFRDLRMLLFLDFVEKERSLPILDMSWNLISMQDHPDSIIRFRFFLLRWNGGESRPRAVGFRLEPPEGSGNMGFGNHDYWHVQMISELEKGDDFLRRVVGMVPEWIPTKQPAFPLPAKRLGDLLAALLVSVYGAKQIGRIAVEVGVHGLMDRLRGMGIPFNRTS